MSLLRLLTAGKCLIGLKKPEARYHLPGNRSLPRFGPKKNPFRATVIPDKADSSGLPSAESDSNRVGGSEGAISQGPGEVCSEDRAVAPAQPDSPVAVPVRSQAPPVGKSEGRAGLRALLLWSRARKPRSRIGAHGRPLVQAELSLDSVKVVRNDLSESDLEVVQARSAVLPDAAQEKLRESGSCGGAGRLVGLGKT